MSESWTSFEGVLRYACHVLQPTRILEWGPGDSTLIMAQECPDAHILSIEHQEPYYQAALKRTKMLGNVQIVLAKRACGDANEGMGYIGEPLRAIVRAGAYMPSANVFDLVFVDGRDRQDCLSVAFALVKEEGLVLLHDALRKRYRQAIEMYPHHLIIGDTAVMSRGRALDGFLPDTATA